MWYGVCFRTYVVLQSLFKKMIPVSVFPRPPLPSSFANKITVFAKVVQPFYLPACLSSSSTPTTTSSRSCVTKRLSPTQNTHTHTVSVSPSLSLSLSPPESFHLSPDSSEGPRSRGSHRRTRQRERHSRQPQRRDIEKGLGNQPRTLSVFDITLSPPSSSLLAPHYSDTPFSS